MIVHCKPLIIEQIEEAKRLATRSAREIERIVLTQHEYSQLLRQSPNKIQRPQEIIDPDYRGQVCGIDIYVEPETDTENKNNDS